MSVTHPPCISHDAALQRRLRDTLSHCFPYAHPPPEKSRTILGITRKQHAVATRGGAGPSHQYGGPTVKSVSGTSAPKMLFPAFHTPPKSHAKTGDPFTSREGADDGHSSVQRNYSAQFALASPKPGVSRFGLAGCLTELGIVHQGVARQGNARSFLYCATP
jgi:hypothetical protein